VLSFVGPARLGWQMEDVIVIGERIMVRRWKGGKREPIYAAQGQFLWGSQNCTLYKLEYLVKSNDPPRMTIGFR